MGIIYFELFEIKRFQKLYIHYERSWQFLFHQKLYLEIKKSVNRDNVDTYTECYANK